MMKKIKISSYGIMMLVFFLSTCFFNPFVSSIILKTTYNDSWISMIIGFLSGFIILWLALKLDLVKNQNIIDRNNKNIFGKFLNIILCILIIILSSTLLIKTTTFISNNYLNSMSVLLISIISFLVIMYATFKGIEPIVRTGQILFTICIIISLAYIIMLIYYMDITNILPILNHSIWDIIISSIYYLVFSLLPILVILIIPKNLVNDDYYNRCILTGYFIAFIYNVIFVLSTIFVGNSFVIDSFDYPTYFVINNIKYFSFIERLDNIFTIPHIFSIFMFLIMSLLFINEFIKNLFKIKKDNIYVLSVISLIIIIVSLTFRLIL